MSFIKVKAVSNLRIRKFKIFWLLLVISTCSFDLIQAQAASANIALIKAIQNNKLTQAGADINDGNVNVFDNNHKVPLTYAVQSTTDNAFTFVTDLLNSNNPSSSIADPTVVDTSAGSAQKTILMSALESTNEGILLNGLSNSSSPVYTTIIQTLLTQLKKDGVSLLIDINAKDLNGKTALDYALAAKNFYAPIALMTLLLTPGINIPANFTLSPIQKNTQKLWADLITPSTNLVLAPNTVNLNFNLATVLADISAGIDPNAQDNTGTTALMYVAQALASTTTTPTLTQTSNLTSVLTALLALPNIDLNLSNLGQPVGLNNNNSNFASMVTVTVTAPFGYPSGQTAGGSAGFLTTNLALNTATSNQAAALTTLFTNLNTGAFGTAGTPPQAVLTSANINYRDPNSNYWTPLIYAVKNSTASVTAVLGFNNVAINAQEDQASTTALMYAAQATSNALTIIQALLQNSSINSNIRDDNGMTALMWAIQQGQGITVINALLAAPNLDLNITDNYNRTALSLAYTSQNPQPAVITAITNGMRAQLVTAINNGDLTTVKNTISTITNCSNCQCTNCPILTTIDMVDSNDLTPLMYAVKSLNSNIDPATKPTPLPVVIEIIDALLSAGANFNATDATGVTPLMYATQSQNSTIDTTVKPNLPLVATVINTLVSNGANLTATDNNQHNAYYYAQQLTTANKKTILQTLSALANAQLVQDLQNAATTITTIRADMAAGADVNFPDSTNNNTTPLMYAAQSANSNALAIVQLLLNANVNIDAVDSNDQTALMHVAQSTNANIDTSIKPNIPVTVEIIQALNQQALKNNENIILQEDNSGNTAYYYATQNSTNTYQSAIIQALVASATSQLFIDLQNPKCSINALGEDLSAGASVALTDDSQHNAYYYAQQLPASNINKATIIQAIITTATSQLFSDLQNSTTPPTLALIQADLAAGASANINFTDGNNKTAFYYAQQLPSTNTNKSAIVQAIVAAATTQLFSDLQNTTTPPILATIQADLAAGANVNQIDSKNKTPLMYAQQLPTSNTNKPAIIKAIQQAVITSLSTQLFNDLQNSAVTLETIQSDLASSFSFGINITAVVDANNHTSLYYAQQLPNTNTSKVAIVQTIATTQLFNDLQNTTTPPTLAIIQADLTAGANVASPGNYPSSYGKTALTYANKLSISNTDKSAIIQAITAAATNQLFSDLQNTIVVPTLAIIQADITAGANVNQIDSKNKTPLMYAQLLPSANTAKAAIIQLIQTTAAGSVTNQLFSDLQNSAVILTAIQADLAAGANVNAVDSEGMTPLMYAAQSQVSTIDTTVTPNVPVVIEILQTLINAMQKTGAQNSIYAQDSNKHTALYYAQQLTGNSNQAAIETIIATAQLFYDIVNPNCTLVTIQSDIAAGANVAALGFDQKTTLYYANLLPATNTAKAVIITALKTAATPQLLLDLQNPNSTLAEIQADITAGADINYLDAKNNNMTPLMYAAQSQNSLVDTTVKPSVPVIVEIINFILSNSALTTAGNVFAQDKNGNTAYYYAQQSGNPNQVAIETLFTTIATPQLFTDLQQIGVTLDMINLDIAAGSNVNAADNTGMTPLMYAAQSQNKLIDRTASPATPVALEIINALINANANNATLDKNSHTALYYARNNWGNSTIFQTAPYEAQIIAALTPSDTVSLGSTKQNNLKQAPTTATLQSPASVTAPTTPVKPVTAVTQTPVPAPVLATTPIVPAAPIAPGKPVLKTPRAKVKTIKRAKQATTAKLPNRPSPKA